MHRAVHLQLVNTLLLVVAVVEKSMKKTVPFMVMVAVAVVLAAAVVVCMAQNRPIMAVLVDQMEEMAETVVYYLQCLV